MSEREERELRALVEEATSAAQRDDWDQAVDRMRKAVGVTTDPEMVAAGSKNLATVLYSRATRTVDRGMARINDATRASGESHIQAGVNAAIRSRHRRSWKLWVVLVVIVAPIAWWTYGLYEPDEVWIDPFWTRIGAVAMMTGLVVLLLRWGLVWLLESVSSSTDGIVGYGKAPPCWVCGGGSSYHVDVPGHGQRLLCGVHAGNVETAMQGVVADAKGVKMLRSAEKDLAEAKTLDPGLSQAGQLLTEVGSVLRRLGRS